MIINEPVTVMRARDVGRLDHALRLPMSGRLRAKMKTICNVCRTKIEDEYFVCGFKAGWPNLLLHESCVGPEDMPLEGFHNEAERADPERPS